MNKKRIVIIFFALFSALLCVLFITSRREFKKIDMFEVEEIANGKWTLDQTAKFVKLFNDAKYAGETDGSGGTPELIIHVGFYDGSYLLIAEFNGIGRDFEVSLRGEDHKEIASYYIASDELFDYVWTLCGRW